MPTDISKMISDAAYQAYERRLLHQVKGAAIPHHVAIIMDGNRRFAREIGLGNVLDGHVKGRDKLEEVLEWCLEVGVRILTVFAFSTENIRRANEEVEHLMHLFAENFRRVGDDVVRGARRAWHGAASAAAHALAEGDGSRSGRWRHQRAGAPRAPGADEGGRESRPHGSPARRVGGNPNRRGALRARVRAGAG